MGTQSIEELKKKHELEIMTINGVEGLGITEQNGTPCIVVYYTNLSISDKKTIEKKFANYKVLFEKTSSFIAF